MTNNDKAADEVTSLKKEVEYLKGKLDSVSKSELTRNIETQKLKIHAIEETRIGISWLFKESKVSCVISIFLPLLPAMFAFGFARVILDNILHGQAETVQMLVDFGLNFAPMLMMPPLIFIVVYVVGFEITFFIAGIIVKRHILKREKNKLRMLESH